MILIIGGTSGIGLETAKYLQTVSKDVLVASRTNRQETIPYKFVDVQNEDSVKELFGSIGKLEALIYATGITTKKKNIQNFDKDRWENLVDVNVTGALLCLKYAYPALKAAKGKVVIVNSLATRTYSMFSGVEYTMSKSALSGMVKQLSIEFAEDGVAINSVFPSMTKTPMLIENVSDDALKNIEASILMKRIAEPVEIAKAINFLISDDNSYMTGCGLDLNGGQFLNG